MPDNNNINNKGVEAAFVFTGKVVKSRAATMHDIPTDNTLIVQIAHIIKAPPIFASMTGHEVTVRFKELPPLNEGTEITVFANGWIFGETIALDAVSYSVETDKKAVASMVQTSATASADNVLKERVNSAQLGVVGTVVKIEKIFPSEAAQTLMAAEGNPVIETTRISEHDPDWHQATIQVDEVVKGGSGTKEAKVLFPKSDDVRWYNIPKFKEGQQGIWLLQQGKTQDANGIAPKVFAAIPEAENVFTTLHADDFLPLHELGRVKSLLNK